MNKLKPDDYNLAMKAKMKYSKLNELLKEWERERTKRELYIGTDIDDSYEQGYINALFQCIQDVKTLILISEEI